MILNCSFFFGDCLVVLYVTVNVAEGIAVIVEFVCFPIVYVVIGGGVIVAAVVVSVRRKPSEVCGLNQLTQRRLKICYHCQHPTNFHSVASAFPGLKFRHHWSKHTYDLLDAYFKQSLFSSLIKPSRLNVENALCLY